MIELSKNLLDVPGTTSVSTIVKVQRYGSRTNTKNNNNLDLWIWEEILFIRGHNVITLSQFNCKEYPTLQV